MKSTFFRALSMFLCISLSVAVFSACNRQNNDNDASLKSRRALFQSLKPNLALPVSDRLQVMPAELLEATRAYDKSIGIRNTDRYRPRVLSAEERALIDSYLKLLPPAHQSVFKEKLLALYLVDDFAGAGLTDWVVDDDGRVYYYLAFNSELLSIILDDWLTFKDDGIFDDSKSSIALKVRTQTAYKALLYGLLHEGAHIVDYERGITPYVDPLHRQLTGRNGTHSDFTAGVWEDRLKPHAEYEFAHRGKYNLYRVFPNIPLIPRAEMPGMISRLKDTPFVSFYSASSWNEHVADYLTYYHLERNLGAKVTLSLYEDGAVTTEYEPMQTNLARKLEEPVRAFYK